MLDKQTSTITSKIIYIFLMVGALPFIGIIALILTYVNKGPANASSWLV